MSYQQIVRTADPTATVALSALEHDREGLKEYTLSEYLQHEKGKVVNFKKLRQPGASLAELYRSVAKKEPGAKLVECNSRAVSVKAYTNKQIPGAADGVTGFTLMDRILREHSAALGIA